MKQWRVSVKCEMEVKIDVLASSRAEIEKWVARSGPSFYSVVETPTHRVGAAAISSISETKEMGFCPDIKLPVSEWDF